MILVNPYNDCIILEIIKGKVEVLEWPGEEGEGGGG